MTSKIVGFVGAPSSGKTSSARHLYSLLRNRDVDASYVSEAARDFITVNKGIFSSTDQYNVMFDQSLREKKAKSLCPVVVTDSPVFLGKIFMEKYYPKNYSLEIDYLADAHKYDYLFYLPRRPLVNDGVRFQTEEDNADLDDRIISYMGGRGIVFTPLTKDLDYNKKFLQDFVKEVF